jgi:hypothetical protein
MQYKAKKKNFRFVTDEKFLFRSKVGNLEVIKISMLVQSLIAHVTHV